MAARTTFAPVTFKAAAKNNSKFQTRRTAADRVSDPVTLLSMHYDETNHAIKVFCADGTTRVCKIDRLPDAAAGRALWSTLQKAGKAEQEVKFVAAGGFDPTKWFYTVI
jgi:hypothetical protein